jgi:hypothetical protein
LAVACVLLADPGHVANAQTIDSRVLLDDPGHSAIAQTIDSCGQLSRHSSCLVFVPFDDPDIYALPDSFPATDPGFYHVTAEYYRDPVSCAFWPYSHRLRNVTIGPCSPDTFGCGRIQQSNDGEDDCLVWSSLRDHNRFLVGDLKGFQVNDVVLAVGVLCPAMLCPPVPGRCPGGVLLDMQLLACPDSLNAAPETPWGRIK